MAIEESHGQKYARESCTRIACTFKRLTWYRLVVDHNLKPPVANLTTGIAQNDETDTKSFEERKFGRIPPPLRLIPKFTAIVAPLRGFGRRGGGGRRGEQLLMMVTTIGEDAGNIDCPFPNRATQRERERETD